MHSNFFNSPLRWEDGDKTGYYGRMNPEGTCGIEFCKYTIESANVGNHLICDKVMLHSRFLR